MVLIVCGLVKLSSSKKTISEVNNTILQNTTENNIIDENTVTTSSNAIYFDTTDDEFLPQKDFSNLSNDEKATSIPVLMYHFFYDSSKGQTAKDGNYLEITHFEDHLKYLTENDYYFPTWNEVSDFIDGKINLPKKSVVLTIDDGSDSFFEIALPVVEKYEVRMTEFLVTSWNGWYKNDYPAKQMSYQSHSDNMHKAGANGKGVMMSWSYEQMLEDLNSSREVLGDECIAYCYPFGQYNDTAKRAVKDAGFKLAFTTEGGRVKNGQDKYALPRVRTSSSTTLAVFKGLVS